MKSKDWFRDKKQLIKEYEKNGITTCEGSSINLKCLHNFALSFHHLDRRSSGNAENTFEATRLLCPDCHQRADQMPGFKEFNEKLRSLR